MHTDADMPASAEPVDEMPDSNQHSRRPNQLEQLFTKLLQGIVRSIFFVLKVRLHSILRVGEMWGPKSARICISARCINLQRDAARCCGNAHTLDEDMLRTAAQAWRFVDLMSAAGTLWHTSVAVDWTPASTKSAFCPQAIPQKLRLNRRSGWAVLLGVAAAFCFGAIGPAAYSTARPPQEVGVCAQHDVVQTSHL